jgi:hypothetical protein
MDLSTTAFQHLGPQIYSYISTWWVKGHQDRYLAYNKMSTQIENTTSKARTEWQHYPNHAWSPFQANVYNSSSTAMQYHSHTPNGCVTRSLDTICDSTFRIDMIGMTQHGTSSTGMGSERPSDLGPQQCHNAFPSLRMDGGTAASRDGVSTKNT